MDLINSIFDRTMPGLNKALDLHRKRTEAISSNIANIETPGYQAIDVNFAGELEKAFSHGGNNKLIKTNSRHIDLAESSGESFLTLDSSGARRADGNNVDIDIQMAKLADAGGAYSKASALVRKKLQVLRYAIRQGEM